MTSSPSGAQKQQHQQDNPRQNQSEEANTATNETLIKFLPELASLYGKYPLRYHRWLSPGERGPNGEPCFITASQDMGVKHPYVWGNQGSKGAGYYHLLTKAAYTILYNKLKDNPPEGYIVCCSCSQKARLDREEWEFVKRIIYHRHASTVPDDGVAQNN